MSWGYIRLFTYKVWIVDGRATMLEFILEGLMELVLEVILDKYLGYVLIMAYFLGLFLLWKYITKKLET